MNTPVLFLIFNRPEYTKRVYEEIRKARPTKLFVAADGPRRERPGEAELCQEAREIIKTIDWPCQVETLFREKNLGCKLAVSGGISWFFEQVEEGIILEDDCLPDQSFFQFSTLMLERYRDNPKVGMISGTNFLSLSELEEIDPGGSRYYFIRPTYIWGWATWKRAWAKYDLAMTSWPKLKEERYLNEVFENPNTRGFFNDYFDMAYDGRAKTWDIQWFFSSLVNDMLSIVPPRNLITNIGNLGSHNEKETVLNNRKRYSISISELNHPKEVVPDLNFENKTLIHTGAALFSLRRLAVKFLELIGLKGLVRWLYHRFMLNS